MSKYQPIEQHLRDCRTSEVAMSFKEIERVLGGRLPPAARNHRAWWSNNPSNNVMTKSWLAAGFTTERVDMASERLVFKKANSGFAPPQERQQALAGVPKPRLVERIHNRLAGAVTIPEGVDITQPTGEVWDAEA